MERISEQALLLGPRKSLVGVMSQSATHPPPPDRPVVVILNSGIIHRVGPNRMSVTLARTLAARGFAVLRFDLSGIGDSEPRADVLPPLEAAFADIREALDSLEASRGPVKVVLAGLCSGADHSALYGGTDPRVVGLVLLDPSVPRTRRYYVNHYAPRMLRASSWSALVQGRHPLWRELKNRISMAPKEGAFDGRLIDTPEVRAILERGYKGSVVSGIRMLAVCTADRDSRLNYREQLLEAFPTVDFGSSLRLEYFEDADHTFTAHAQRSRLIELIVQWITSTTFKGCESVAKR
jgi:pimeloyl-ACP methyl ester carboxylesterase